MSQGNIISWKKKEGDKVKAGESIAEVETDKAVMSWDSADDGKNSEFSQSQTAPVVN